MTLARKKIRDSISELGKADAYEIYTGQVVSIDEANQCVDVAINDDLTIPAVRLKVAKGSNVGMYILPKKDSYCAIAKMDGGVDFCLLQCSEIDKLWVKIGDMTFEMTKDGMTFNDGNNKGLVILDKLKANQDLIKQNFDTLKAGIASGFGAIGVDSGAGATAFNAATSAIAWNWQDMENTKVKH